MATLISLIPDVDVLVSLASEELAEVSPSILRWQRERPKRP